MAHQMLAMLPLPTVTTYQTDQRVALLEPLYACADHREASLVVSACVLESAGGTMLGPRHLPQKCESHGPMPELSSSEFVRPPDVRPDISAEKCWSLNTALDFRKLSSRELVPPSDIARERTNALAIYRHHLQWV